MTSLCIQPSGNSPIKPVGVKWYQRQFDPYIQEEKKTVVQKIKSLSVGQIFGGAVSILGIVDLLKNLIFPKENQSFLSKLFMPVALFFLGGFNVAVTEPPKDRFRRDLFNTAAKESSEKFKEVAEKPDSNILFSNDDFYSLYQAIQITSNFLYDFLDFDKHHSSTTLQRRISLLLKRAEAMKKGRDSGSDVSTTLAKDLEKASAEEDERVSLEFEKVLGDAMQGHDSPFKEELIKIQEVLNKGLEKLQLKVTLDFRSNDKLIDFYVASSSSFSLSGTDQKYVPFKVFSCDPFVFFKSLERLGDRLTRHLMSSKTGSTDSVNNPLSETTLNKILLFELVRFVDRFPQSNEVGYFILDGENKSLSQRRIGNGTLLNTLLEDRLVEEIKSSTHQFFAKSTPEESESSDNQTKISNESYEPSWIEGKLKRMLLDKGFHGVEARVVIDRIKETSVITAAGSVPKSLFNEFSNILESFKLWWIKLRPDCRVYSEVRFDRKIKSTGDKETIVLSFPKDLNLSQK